jgi:hypothetical protein
MYAELRELPTGSFLVLVKPLITNHNFYSGPKDKTLIGGKVKVVTGLVHVRSDRGWTAGNRKLSYY